MNKKITKIVIGLLAPSLVTSMGIVTVKNLKSDKELSYAEKEVLKDPAVIKAEKEVEKAKEEVKEAKEGVEEAENAKKAAEKEVKSANKTIAKAMDAKKAAEIELSKATTPAQKQAAKAKLKAAEEALEKAKETKKAAEKKVTQATKEVKEAKEEVKQAEAKVEKKVEKAEEVKKEVAKENKAAEQNTQKESNRQFTDEQLKYMLEQAKKGEERQRQEYEAAVQAQKDAAAAKKAEREAQEQAAREQAEREAQERAARESTESLKNRGVATQDTVFGDREFTFAQKNVDVSFDPNTRDNPQVVTCTGSKCGPGQQGYIWFARFRSNFNIFRAPGSNNYVNNALIGRRGDVTSWTQYAPNEIDGHHFTGWSISTEYLEGMTINVYTANYN